MFLGDNMAETRPVNFGQLNERRLRRNARMVVLDPRRTATAQKADEWLPIRPGTDLAFALGCLHHILSRDLIDHRFVAEWVEGYEKVRDFILARGYTPAWAEPITDISAATIARIAEEYATTRAPSSSAIVALASTDATQTFRALLMMAAVTGHLGRKGAGVLSITSAAHPGACAGGSRGPRRPAVRRSPADGSRPW
jgi:anaerobic selenocysteine-containing dehydrogenase